MNAPMPRPLAEGAPPMGFEQRSYSVSFVSPGATMPGGQSGGPGGGDDRMDEVLRRLGCLEGEVSNIKTLVPTLATREDIQALRTEHAELRAQLRGELRVEAHALRDQLHAQTGSLRDQVHQESASLRDQLTGARQEGSAETRALRDQLTGVRQEAFNETRALREEAHEFRLEVLRNFKELGAKIDQFHTELHKEIGRIALWFVGLLIASAGVALAAVKIMQVMR